MNPIEQFFAKLKHWLRKAAKRTTEAVYNACETASSAGVRKPLANVGYHQA
jgi:transposase